MASGNTPPRLKAEREDLRTRLAEAEETLRAIRDGDVDALVLGGNQGAEVHLLGAGDRIYRQFMETVHEGTATLNASGEILSCNASFAKMLQRPLDQVLGTAMRDHLSPDDRKTFSEILAEAGLDAPRRKIHLQAGGGSLVPIYLSATILHSAGAEPVVSLVCTDLEEVVSAEEALRREHARTQRYLDTVETIIVALDARGRITKINRKGCEILGWSEEELLGRHWFSACVPQPEGMEKVYPQFLRLMAGELEAMLYFENPIVTKSGELRQIAWHNAVLRDDQGRICGTLSSGDDITERRRLEDQLRQAQKVESIGRLAGGVAHDFNNLTAIILGYGEMLLGRLRPEDPLRKYAEQIMEAGLRSAALTRQLLAFSRKQTLQPEVLDLNVLLKNFEKMLGRLIREDIRLELKLAATLGRVTADPGQIEQVVTNLVLNARDAMAKGGRLTIETADVELDQIYALGHVSVVPGRYVMLAVTDTGCGIDEANMAKLFEPFFTTKEKGEGTGLGLATAYGIVKQSGGYLWAYSEPGKGTSFKIYLPRTDAAATEKAAQPGGEAPRGRGELILLVEDETSLREMCETVLVHLGYRVSAAGSGPEALLLMEEKRLEPDLVITDVIMPVMSGSEMAERLRKDRPYLKVLYMSGYPDDAISRHGVLDPGTPFIQKPFNERTLATKVRETLGGTQPGRSVLLVDLNIPVTSGEQVLRETRAAGNSAPAIVLTGDVASADMDALRPLGVVRALAKSSDAGPLLQAIEDVCALENTTVRRSGEE